jgi:peroxiredoxin
VAISYDPPEILQAFSRRRGITFPLLSDTRSATITRYGILNTIPDVALRASGNDSSLTRDVQTLVSVAGVNARQVGMAFPGTFVIDRQGRVTSRFFEESYVERSTVSSVMLKLGTGGRSIAGTSVSTAHLDLSTYPTDAAVAPGNRFALVVDITPHRGMHVYAPGATSYRVVTLAIGPQPVLRVLPMKYPASEIYHFKPLNERVPVFQKRFTLVQELVLEATPQAQAALRGKDTVTVEGSLQYQACDDRICYNPESIPLSWTVALRPLITERTQSSVDSR